MISLSNDRQNLAKLIFELLTGFCVRELLRKIFGNTVERNDHHNNILSIIVLFQTLYIIQNINATASHCRLYINAGLGRKKI